jgi:predicted small metal-binding protein
MAWPDASPVSESSRMTRSNTATSATEATARSQARAHRRHPEELQRDGDADAHGSENIVGPLEEELVVVRELRCADLMPGCDFVAQGKDDSEVMKKTAEHAKSVHKMVAIAMDVEKKARASIRAVAGGAG